MNLLREKLDQHQMIKGTLVSLTDPCLCEIMGNVGFDCVWIDMEHTYVSCRDVLCHLNAARSAKIASMVRLPQNDLTATKKILEMGPDAVLFPMVKSYDEFDRLIKTTLYPPLGTRGFGPMRAIDYCADKSKDFVTKGQFELCRFVQIECAEMIDDLDKIAKNPYVDGFIFGANDLSASVNDMLNVFGRATQEQVEKAIRILRENKKLIGFAGGFSPKDIEFWGKLKLDLFFAGGDWTFLYHQAWQTLKSLKSLK